MISEETRQKMRDAHARRVARGEVFGFQKGHEHFRGPITKDETTRRAVAFSATVAKKPKPSCNVCGKRLWKWKDTNCRGHADYAFRKGKPSSNKGRTWKLNLSPEQKARRSEIVRSRVVSEETRAKLRKWHVENPNRKFKDTSIELAVQEELIIRQIPFIKQYSIGGVARVDFYLPEQNVVIQCDGCFWHNCLEHYPEHHQGQRVKDAFKDSKLAEQGIPVFRLWEHDIKRSVSGCIESLNI